MDSAVKKPVPLVQLPNGTKLILDKHHQTLAAFRAGAIEVPAYVAIDLSKQSELGDPNKLNAYLRRHGLVHVYDSSGRILGGIDQLPQHIENLKPDPMLNLVKKLQKEGVIRKSRMAFAELKWAAYLHQQLGEVKVMDSSGQINPETYANAHGFRQASTPP